jgi:hypothetical protein
MSWVEVFTVFVLCHLGGDFLLQTNWQATHKQGGIGRDPVARKALAAHALTYTAAFIPALIWLAGDVGGAVIWAAPLIGVPHWIQDDGRIVGGYLERVKGLGVGDFPIVSLAVDQTLHLLALFGLSLLLVAVGD